MAVTTAQIRAGKEQILDRLYVRYPELRITILRVLLQLYRQGNATDKEVARAILDQAIQAATSLPIGHGAKHIFAELLSQNDAATPDGDQNDVNALLTGVV